MIWPHWQITASIGAEREMDRCGRHSLEWLALWDGPWRMGYHMGCAAFVLTLNDFPHSAPLLESPSLRLHNNYLCGFL